MPPLESGENSALVTGGCLVRCGDGQSCRVEFFPGGQFCSLLEIDMKRPQRGGGLRPSVHRMLERGHRASGRLSLSFHGDIRSRASSRRDERRHGNV